MGRVLVACVGSDCGHDFSIEEYLLSYSNMDY